MTENDVIKWIEAFKKTYKGFPKDSEVACDMAISALKEIQQYRLIQNATIGEIAEVLGEYAEIGTVEECREATEKQKAKKPPIIGADFMVGKDDDENPIWEHDYVCSECGMGIAKEYICCPYCGTYINWSEVRENE